MGRNTNSVSTCVLLICSCHDPNKIVSFGAKRWIMINHLLHFHSVCVSADGMFCCNSVKGWRSDKTKVNVPSMYFIVTNSSTFINTSKLMVYTPHLYNGVQSCRKIHITVICNLEQNVYSNQKEELDKRLNHSERSIFIEYLYIVMINRQKKDKNKHKNGE